MECVEKHMKDYPFLVDAFGPLDETQQAEEAKPAV